MAATTPGALQNAGSVKRITLMQLRSLERHLCHNMTWPARLATPQEPTPRSLPLALLAASSEADISCLTTSFSGSVTQAAEGSAACADDISGNDNSCPAACKSFLEGVSTSSAAMIAWLLLSIFSCVRCSACA